ncbi:MAG: hypothetical protein FJ190_12870 [Gammaproteobacteria bacterium]|nr:hypothetical protein [Gammaproteobacteria bacterium]
MALHFDYALRLRSNSVKTPGLYGYAGVVVHRSTSGILPVLLHRCRYRFSPVGTGNAHLCFLLAPTACCLMTDYTKILIPSFLSALNKSPAG